MLVICDRVLTPFVDGLRVQIVQKQRLGVIAITGIYFCLGVDQRASFFGMRLNPALCTQEGLCPVHPVNQGQARGRKGHADAASFV